MSQFTAQSDQWRKPFAPFLAYLLLFHSAWVFWVYQIYPRLTSLGETTLLYALVNVSLRLLIWVLPVFSLSPPGQGCATHRPLVGHEASR